VTALSAEQISTLSNQFLGQYMNLLHPDVISTEVSPGAQLITTLDSYQDIDSVEGMFTQFKTTEDFLTYTGNLVKEASETYGANSPEHLAVVSFTMNDMIPAYNNFAELNEAAGFEFGPAQAAPEAQSETAPEAEPETVPDTAPEADAEPEILTEAESLTNLHEA